MNMGHRKKLAFVGFLTFFVTLNIFSQVAKKDTAIERAVQIGNHKLFVSERGNKFSGITIVFESGAGGTSKDWAKVIALLPEGIHTIAYDRAGYGKSEKGVRPETMAQSAFELHELLKAIKPKGQMILVGQSLGGLIVRLYTGQYGKEVKGLVLVDPTHESAVLGSMRYGGWTRIREKAMGKPVPKPQIKDSISSVYDTTTDYMAEEFQMIYLSTTKNPRALGDRPLIVIGAGIRKQPPGTPDDQWKQLRAERDKQVEQLTSISGNSKFILDARSGHMVHYDNPEIVAKAILDVIAAIKHKSKL